MVALIAANADIAEEVELGRTLLVQGHLDTAQRVLLKICQEQPECAEAFRVLAMVLSKRGDDRRARPLVEYAEELDAQRTREIPTPLEDIPSDAETQQNRLALHAKVRPAEALKPAEPSIGARPPVVSEPALNILTPKAPISAPPAPALAPAVLASVPPRPAPKSRAGWAIFTVLLFAALAAGAVAAYKQYGRTTPPRPSPREELDRSLFSGTLEHLMRARDVARMALDSGAPDADSLARLGLLNAFLVDDYAVEARKDAEDALRRAEVGPEINKERAAIVASARALLALAAGEREAARKLAEAAIALTAPDSSAFALLVSARVRSLAGDVAGTARDLDRAMGIAPELAPVVVDWATSRLDGGDPVAARRALVTLIERNQDNSRALLLLAEAERALGEPNWVKSLERACRSDAKISRSIRAACAVESAVQARIEGDRAGALRKAKAVSQTSEDAQVLGTASLLLSLLGETDSAEEVLDRARKAADPANVPLLWADLSIRLSRGESVPQLSRVLEHPAGPERDLVALRAAYARTGAAGLTAALKVLPPGIQDIDWDVRAYAALGREGGPPKPELATLEKRLEKGSPVVSYVLGLLAVRDKDFKLAMRRLDKALAWHGDACQAAEQYLDAAKHLGRGAQPNKTGVRNVHAHNAKCPLPEM
jgi:tetratricopeptide (TPR) repeat protein